MLRRGEIRVRISHKEREDIVCTSSLIMSSSMKLFCTLYRRVRPYINNLSSTVTTVLESTPLTILFLRMFKVYFYQMGTNVTFIYIKDHLSYHFSTITMTHKYTIYCLHSIWRVVNCANVIVRTMSKWFT